MLFYRSKQWLLAFLRCPSYSLLFSFVRWWCWLTHLARWSAVWMNSNENWPRLSGTKSGTRLLSKLTNLAFWIKQKPNWKGDNVCGSGGGRVWKKRKHQPGFLFYHLLTVVLSQSRRSQFLTQPFTFAFRFNLIRFASELVSWKPSLTSTSDDSCQDAVEWVTDFDANGSTSTLSALQVCFQCYHYLFFYLPICTREITSYKLQSELKEATKINWFA